MDEPGCPLPEGREPKQPRLRLTVENDMDMTLEEAFAIMDMDVDGEQGTESQLEAQADGRVEVEGQVEAEGRAKEEGQVDGADLILIGENIEQIFN